MDVRSTLATQMDPSKDHSLIVRPAGAVSLRTNPDGVMARMTRGVLAGVGAGGALEYYPGHVFKEARKAQRWW